MYVDIHYNDTMLRTQIYLPSPLHEQLKNQAHRVGVSMSELIRRIVERDLSKAPASDAKEFFQQLKPLKSFEDQDAEGYVRGLRSKSRILRARS